MNEAFANAEPMIRLGSFAAVLAVMIAWETLAPRRRRLVSRWLRWPSNIGIAVLNTVLLRVVFPAAATGFAILAADRGWGLFNLLETPYWVAVVLSVVLLDLAIYTQHVVFHAVPALWRLHRMHHTDIDLDVTSGARFHPLEILLSMLIKLALIALLGAPALAVLVFEVLLNATAMFNHANARLPLGLDRVLRYIVVTPDMHRVHHSVEVDETNSNFGFNLPWWDRLFGTYQDQPRAGHDAMTIGLTEFRNERELWLDRLLLQPLRRDRAIG
ncbi:MAG: sterol desaturase family protein [Gammaproteobacteria bacterium]|nr:sterol desaturase family protein [Gammaproteobacteria bacterium]